MKRGRRTRRHGSDEANVHNQPEERERGIRKGAGSATSSAASPTNERNRSTKNISTTTPSERYIPPAVRYGGHYEQAPAIAP